MSEYKFPRSDEYECVAVKRDWVPEWLWRALGPLPRYWPFTSLLTREASGPAETPEGTL